MRRKRQSIVQSRATIMWSLVFFALIQVGLDWLMHSVGPQPGYDPEYAFKLGDLRARLRENGRIPPLVLALGSSRIATAFHPEECAVNAEKNDALNPRLFNLGICLWMGPFPQSIVLRRTLDAGIHPDFVVLEFFPAHLPYPLYQLQLIERSRLGWHDLDVITKYVAEPRKERLNWLLSTALPAWSERFLLLQHFWPDWIEAGSIHTVNWAHRGSWGWTCIEPYAKSRPIPDDVKKSYQTFLQNPSIAEASRRGYRDLLQLCKDKGIGAGLIMMPEPSLFRSWQTPQEEQYVQKIVDEWVTDFGVKIIDARDWMADDQFVEGVHLTHRGAIAFTQRFEKEQLQSIIAPMITKLNSGSSLRHQADSRGVPVHTIQ